MNEEGEMEEGDKGRAVPTKGNFIFYCENEVSLKDNGMGWVLGFGGLARGSETNKASGTLPGSGRQPRHPADSDLTELAGCITSREEWCWSCLRVPDGHGPAALGGRLGPTLQRAVGWKLLQLLNKQ